MPKKADESLRILLRWLREHLTEHLQVIYQGVKEPGQCDSGKMNSTASQSIEDLMRLVALALADPRLLKNGIRNIPRSGVPRKRFPTPPAQLAPWMPFITWVDEAAPIWQWLYWKVWSWWMLKE